MNVLGFFVKESLRHINFRTLFAVQLHSSTAAFEEIKFAEFSLADYCRRNLGIESDQLERQRGWMSSMITVVNCNTNRLIAGGDFYVSYRRTTSMRPHWLKSYNRSDFGWNESDDFTAFQLIDRCTNCLIASLRPSSKFTDYDQLIIVIHYACKLSKSATSSMTIAYLVI